MSDELMNQALAATAAGAQTPPVVATANGNGPTAPPQAPPAAQQPPLAAQPAPEPAPAPQAPRDEPVKGDTTVMQVELAQLRAQLAQAQRTNRRLALVGAAACGFALLVLYMNAPRGVPIIDATAVDA
jgi:hypothetical protein